MKRTKLFHAFLFVPFFIVNISAHITSDSSFHHSHAYLDFKGGFNLSSMFGSGVDQMDYSEKPEWAGNLSLMVGYKPVKWLAIETGAMVIGKGLANNKTINYQGYDFTLERENRDGFIEFPLIVKPTLILPSWNLFYGLVGISYARQFKASFSADVSYDNYGETERENLEKADLMEEGIPLPTDTAGGSIIVPYKDLYRMQDASLILGMGWELGKASFSKSNSFIIEFKYLIGLIDQTYMSKNGRRLVNEAAYKYGRYLYENNIDPSDVGIEEDGEYIENPINRYHTFTISIGFKHYF